MSLTRSKVKEILSTAGVDGDHMDAAVQAIIDGHTATVDSLKEERDGYKKDAAELPNLQKELQELKKTNDGSDSYKEKYDALQKEFDDYKSAQTEKEMTEQKRTAYSDLLKESGVDAKRINTILKVADFDGMELNKDGKLKDAEKLKDSIKSEWADFIVSEGKTGAEVKNPPAGKGGGNMTKDDIMKIKDPGERQAAIADNHELFGF